MLKSLEISGFKSFANKSTLNFDAPISAMVGPNGSGKSNAAEAFRFVLGEQSLKALRVSKTDELLFNGGQNGRRRNRAHVKARFDNSQDVLDVDYDEVVVERVIERGDASTYRLNGSNVRLKDVTDLLADANIGTSRHHIISQGEADRVLNVNKRDRKTIIEDALGLRRFYRRRREAEKKLSKTEDNLASIQERLNDIKPEFKYLKRKKSQIQKTKQLRRKLTTKYQQYFRRQTLKLNNRKHTTESQKQELKKEKKNRQEKIDQLQEQLSQVQTDDNSKKPEAVTNIEKEIESVESELSSVTEKYGEVSGSIRALKGNLQSNQSTEKDSLQQVRQSRLDYYAEKFEQFLAKYESADEETQIKKAADHAVETVKKFIDEFKGNDTSNDEHKSSNIKQQINSLKEKQGKLNKKRNKLKEKKRALKEDLIEAKSQSNQQQSEQHKLEKEVLQLEAKQETTATKLGNVNEKLESIAAAKDRLEDEKSEAKVLCGEASLEHDNADLIDQEGSTLSEDEFLNRDTDRSFKRELERLKIKLEDARVSDPKEVMAEFERVKDRIEFFEGEIADLQETQGKLLDLIDDIKTTAKQKFMEGVADINDVFSRFFSTMFGGGSAELFVTKHPAGRNVTIDQIDDEPEDIDHGVGIRVKLPNKKVRGLEVLSGGERALTSIALLFSLSQINPPPFIVLDEADAALDEANSRRFGDIIEELSEHSQLIIITHNRETMRRADVLYGVTMDQAGGSRLLSLSFSEAVESIEE